MNFISYLPKDLIDIVLEYDGRIKEKMGKYVNIIHKHDLRYKIITPTGKKNETNSL